MSRRMFCMPTELVGVLANNHLGERSGNKKIFKDL